MKRLLPFLAAALAIGFGGCKSTPLTVEHDAEKISTILGVPESELVFVSDGDVAVAEEFTDFFKPSDAAVIALTEDALYWLHLDSTLADQVTRIPAADIVTLSRDLGCFQVKTNDELYLVRLRGWNRHRGDGPRSLEFMAHLLKANGSLFVADAEYVYQKPLDEPPQMRGHIDNQSDPNIVHGQLNIRQ